MIQRLEVITTHTTRYYHDGIRVSQDVYQTAVYRRLDSFTTRITRHKDGTTTTRHYSYSQPWSLI